MMIIAVNNNKGGVLKTTTTSNLAGVLAHKKKRVLLVDADNQSNLALSFGHNPDNYRTTLYDVLVGGVPPEDAIQQVNEYIDLLPSNDDLISFDFDVIGDREHFSEPFFLMKQALQHLVPLYDYILIDTPPSLSLMNGNVFAFADKVLIPYQPEAYSMRSLLAVIRTIREFTADINPSLDILGVFFTKVIANSTLHSAIIQETKKYAFEKDVHVFETMIPRSVQYANSIGFDAKPLTFMKKSEKGKLYFDLWDELEAEIRKEVVQ